VSLALYAIGDLHLSFGVDKPMDVFGSGWVNYAEKIKAGFQCLKPDDLCVLCGDTSWGMNLKESLKDFRFIDSLPGKKIILKGNHDYWWETVTKMKAFFDANGIKSIDILHNNSFIYNETAICGTRGWLNEEGYSTEQNDKIMLREITRLRTSLKSAGDSKAKLCFFHYPLRTKKTVCHELIAVMNEFGAKKCIYGHLHGDGHHIAIQGEADGIEYKMVSADYVGFVPQQV